MSKIHTKIHGAVGNLFGAVRAHRLLARGRMRGAGLRGSGFTLIELLTVIAIIAILAAVIFPVFMSAREKTKQDTCISNLHEISQGYARYVLDHGGRGPDVLFAYVPPSTLSSGCTPNPGQAVSMSSVQTYFTAAVSGGSTSGTSVVGNPSGLYPAYVNDASVFTDPENGSLNAASAGKYVAANVNTMDTNGNLSQATPTNDPLLTSNSPEPCFFQADAFDVSPEIASPGKLALNFTANPNTNGYTLVPRYQRAWTSILPNATLPTTTPASTLPALTPPIPVEAYPRQLATATTGRGETYVTCTTYHVGNGKVIALFKDGNAHSFDSGVFLRPGPDVPDISVPTSGSASTVGASPARFWEIKPDATY